MRYGFRICYHKDVSLAEIKPFLDDMVGRFTRPDSYKTGGRCSSSFFRRGVFGLRTDKGGSGSPPRYTFRRLSRGRRIFGVVPVGSLEGVGGPLELNQCMCAHHLGGQRVRLRGGFREEDFVTYFETGEIKG